MSCRHVSPSNPTDSNYNRIRDENDKRTSVRSTQQEPRLSTYRPRNLGNSWDN